MAQPGSKINGTMLNRRDTQHKQKWSHILILHGYKKLSLMERYLLNKS